MGTIFFFITMIEIKLHPFYLVRKQQATTTTTTTTITYGMDLVGQGANGFMRVKFGGGVSVEAMDVKLFGGE